MSSSLDDSKGKALAIFGCLLAVILTIQFLLRRYFAPVYWAAIVLISITGTLITDILADDDNVSHHITTGIFGGLLVISFITWFLVEGTLSIHSIYSARREAFYWNVVLWTFALWTSTGDQMAEDAELGYWRVLVIMVGILVADFIINELFKRFLKPP